MPPNILSQMKQYVVHFYVYSLLCFCPALRSKSLCLMETAPFIQVAEHSSSPIVFMGVSSVSARGIRVQHVGG